MKNLTKLSILTIVAVFLSACPAKKDPEKEARETAKAEYKQNIIVAKVGVNKMCTDSNDQGIKALYDNLPASLNLPASTATTSKADMCSAMTEKVKIGDLKGTLTTKKDQIAAAFGIQASQLDNYITMFNQVATICSTATDTSKLKRIYSILQSQGKNLATTSDKAQMCKNMQDNLSFVEYTTALRSADTNNAIAGAIASLTGGGFGG